MKEESFEELGNRIRLVLENAGIGSMDAYGESPKPASTDAWDALCRRTNFGPPASSPAQPRFTRPRSEEDGPLSPDAPTQEEVDSFFRDLAAGTAGEIPGAQDEIDCGYGMEMFGTPPEPLSPAYQRQDDRVEDGGELELIHLAFDLVALSNEPETITLNSGPATLVKHPHGWALLDKVKNMLYTTDSRQPLAIANPEDTIVFVYQHGPQPVLVGYIQRGWVFLRKA